MKILLITPYFAPDDNIGSARWNRLAKYFIQNDCQIYVIASNLSTTLTETELCTKLVRVSYGKSFIDSTLRTFSNTKKDFTVEQIRQSRKGNNNITIKIYSKLIEVIGRLLRFPGAYWWSSSEIVKVGVPIIYEENIDIIIATHPYSISLRAASIISSKTGIPWVADMRDGWSSYYFGDYKFGTIYYYLLRLLEKFYLSTAVIVVSINNSLSNSLACDSSKIRVLPNVFDFDNCLIQEVKPNIKPTIDFAFAGSVHHNHSWDLLFEAISNTSKNIQDGQIKINYFGGNYSIILEKLNRWQINNNLVCNHGYLNKSSLYKSMLESDLLLVFGFSGAFGDTVTTGKIFDYIEIGKPIIVIGPRSSELAKLVIETQIGIVLSSAVEVQEFIYEAIKDVNKFITKTSILRNTNALNNYSSMTVGKKYLDLLKNVSTTS
jgi:glycosyltransferase involved in cell wall biosynthesis